MADLRNTDFVRDDILPSYWANAIQQFVSGLSAGFRVERQSATTVRVPAAGGRSAIAVDGKWRWRDTDVSRAVAGGAGTYDVFIVALDEDVTNVPDPFTDNTDRSFDLRIVADGTTPAVAPADPAVEIFEGPVATLVWDGAAITSFAPQGSALAAAIADYEAAFSTWKDVQSAAGRYNGGGNAVDNNLLNVRMSEFATPPGFGASRADWQGFIVVPADGVAGARVAKYRVRAVAVVGGTAPGINYAVRLYRITAVAGGPPLITAVAAVGNVATVNAPGANAISPVAESSAFTLATPGVYALGYVQSGGAPAATDVQILATLQEQQAA